MLHRLNDPISIGQGYHRQREEHWTFLAKQSRIGKCWFGDNDDTVYSNIQATVNVLKKGTPPLTTLLAS